MKELTEMMVRAVVNHPDQVAINEVEATDSLILEIKVAPGDMGKLIGKSGRTINAMRTIVSAASAAKRDKRINLEVIEPKEGAPGTASERDRWA